MRFPSANCLVVPRICAVAQLRPNIAYIDLSSLNAGAQCMLKKVLYKFKIGLFLTFQKRYKLIK